MYNYTRYTNTDVNSEHDLLIIIIMFSAVVSYCSGYCNHMTQAENENNMPAAVCEWYR